MRSLICSLALCGLLVTAVPLNDLRPRSDFAEMSAVSHEAASLPNIADTRNELGECALITVIFARGTVEGGNVGALAGPPFFNALEGLVGGQNVAVQGVDYPANIVGYAAGGDAVGASKLASLAKQAASQCPKTQIVLSGYSQGAQVVHLGAAQIPASVAARVAAVVVFGDPNKDQPFPNISPAKVVTFCFLSDLICYGKPIITPSHLAYGINAWPAAAFVKSRVTL